MTVADGVTCFGKPLEEFICGGKHPDGYRRWTATRWPFSCTLDSREDSPGVIHWTLFVPEFGRHDGQAASLAEAAKAVDDLALQHVKDLKWFVDRWIS